MMARFALAALAVALLIPAAAPAGIVEPSTGPWHGTAGSSDLTFRLTQRDGRREIRRLHTTTIDTCASPQPGRPPVTQEVEVAIDHVPVRPDGTFSLVDGDIAIRGRFPSARRVTGMVEVAPIGLTCAGSRLAIAATPGLSDLERYGRCEDVTGRPVISTGSVRVVSRPVHEVPPGNGRGIELVGRRYLGCSLPGGVVRSLGDAGRLYRYDRSAMPRRQGLSSTTRLSVSGSAGRFVFARESASSPRMSSSAGRVVDLATGDSYLVYRRFDDGESAEPQELSTVAPIAWRLSPLGVFAGIYADLADDYTAARSVRAFTETGAQKVLARAAEPDVPMADLGLTARTVGWTEAGVAKSAEISAATPAYAAGLEPGR